MQNKNVRKFQIEIWFSQVANKIQLGKVTIYAETEAKALELAKASTEYFVSGVDQVAWQVREPKALYAV